MDCTEFSRKMNSEELLKWLRERGLPEEDLETIKGRHNTCSYSTCCGAIVFYVFTAVLDIILHSAHIILHSALIP